MYIIGLTGNIATGKSTVMRMLKELGAEIIDADLVGHEVMLPTGPAYRKVIDAFGQGIVSGDGSIDRRRLGVIVFNDANRLQVLEHIVHPQVEVRIRETLKETVKPVVVIEAIKLIEAGLNALCDAVWVVTSPKELQIDRLRETRGLNRADALLRIEAQPPQEEKVKAADVVIENAGSVEALRRRVEEEWARVQQGFHAPQ